MHASPAPHLTDIREFLGQGPATRNEPASTIGIDVAAYLERIRYTGDVTPTLETLRALHLAHLRAVPFENLDIILGRPLSLAPDRLFDKIVRRRRGGFCYELNGLFAILLRELGFDVTLLAAHFPGEPDQPIIECDHLLLLVRCSNSEQAMLADIAGGRRSLATPLPVQLGVESHQPEAFATFCLRQEGEWLQLWLREDGEAWDGSYRFTLQPRRMEEFEASCLHHQTSPESHFTQGRICTRLTPAGRVTLSNLRFISTVFGVRSEEELTSEDAFSRILDLHFGIDLQR